MEGSFKPSNIKKYKGDTSKIFYRSGWELTCMMKFDKNPNVLEWSSEEVKIPYRSILDEAIEIRYKLSYKRRHTYYVDFYVKVKEKDGSTTKYIIEVKPKAQTVEPKREHYKSQRSYVNARNTWIVNSAKWAAAKAYAKQNGMKFEIYTEDQIYGKRT